MFNLKWREGKKIKFINNHLISGMLFIIIGFFIAYFVNFKQDKSWRGLQEFVLFTKGECFHIHHFIYFSLFICFILFGRFIENDMLIISLIGLFIGFSLEDGLFKDWYKIKDNCHKKQLKKVIDQL